MLELDWVVQQPALVQEQEWEQLPRVQVLALVQAQDDLLVPCHSQRLEGTQDWY